MANNVSTRAYLQEEVEAPEQPRQRDQTGAAGERRKEGPASLGRPEVSRRLAQQVDHHAEEVDLQPP